MREFDKKCSKCRNYNGNILICESCAHYKPKQTVFQRITASPEVLAEKFVYCENEEHTFSCASWCSTLLGNTSYARKEEAIAATVKELNKVSK